MSEPRKEILADGVEIWLGDCREVLPLIGRVDAVVTDPPYGIEFRPKTRSTKRHDIYAGGHFATNFQAIRGDDAPFDPSPFLGGLAILWGANNYAHRLPSSNGWLCWYKAAGINGFNMSECELAWTNVLKSTRFFDHMWHGFKRASQNGERVNHPTEKPVEVMKWCLGFVPDTSAIFDPFMGSGSTGVAAVKLGRKFIGIEIDETYFDIARRRITEALKQPDFFVERPAPVKQEALL